MKTRLQLVPLLFLIMAVIASCSVQKRRYTKGWHVDWASSHAKAHANDSPRNKDLYIRTYPVHTALQISETTPALTQRGTMNLPAPAISVKANAPSKAPAITAQQPVKKHFGPQGYI